MRRRPARNQELHAHRATRPAELARRLDVAFALRADLLAGPQTDVCRLFNSAADGIDGLVIEKLGDVLVAQLHEGRLGVSADAVRDLCGRAARRLGAKAVYRKVYPKDRSRTLRGLDRLHHDPAPWIGQPVQPELAVRESGVIFLVRPYDGYATGLFLDHRASRTRVSALAAGRRVLNTFAYTCAFTVAAAVGGAAETVSVDISKKVLEWGRRNLTTNGFALDDHRFIRSDIFDYYRRAVRQAHRFDFIILDPPTFARLKHSRRVLAVTEDLQRLVAGALDLLDPGGILQLSVNHRGTSVRRLEQVVTRAARARHRRCELLDRPSLPEDFRGDADAAKSVFFRLG